MTIPDTNMTKPFCHYHLGQVRESGLLSTTRLAIIEAEIESRISTVHDKDGVLACDARIARFSDGRRMLYPRMTHESDWEYMRRELLADILTSEELALVNKCCLDAQSAAKDRERFEKAEKLDKWDGWVTDGDHYWDSVESYLDERGEEEWTHSYLWVATSQQVIPSLGVDDVTEHWVCDRGWEDMDPTHDLNGAMELQAALDAFVKANETVVSYTMDPTRCVLLDGYIRMKAADEECNRTGIHPIHQR